MADNKRDLAIEKLFRPASVALVGASTDTAKWGYWATQRVQEFGYTGNIHLVNRGGATILGLDSVRTVQELPEVPDAAVVMVPESSFEQTVDELLDLGTKAIIAITAGFGETGADGRVRQENVVARVRAHDAVLVGPNCPGTFDAQARFNSNAWWMDPLPGRVGIVAQSGSVVLDVADRLSKIGIGVSRAAGLGNQADVTLVDLVRNFAHDENTDAILVYAEDVIDGRALFREIARSNSAGTPVVVLTPDAADAVSRAAKSHTGSLVSSRAVIDEAAQMAGAISVSTLPDSVHMIQAVLSPVRATGRRTAIIADAGGFGVLGASDAASQGLEVPPIPDDVQAAVAERLLPGAGVTNPLDLVGVMDVGDIPSMVETVLASDAIDSALVNIVAFIHETTELEIKAGHELAEVSRRCGKPLALCVADPTLPGPQAAAADGVPLYRDMKPAAAALAALADLGTRKSSEPPLVSKPLAPLTLDPLDYLGARTALEDAGLPFGRAVHARDVESAVRAADQLGYPVVVKALGLLHKSDAGGVVLGMRGPDEVRAAATKMKDRLGPIGFAVEEMITLPDSVELILGGHQDPRFGPVVLLGLGGVYSEILRDTAVLLAPTDEETVIRKLKSLRGAGLLSGARGKPAVDVQAVARLVVRLGDFLAAHPEVKEIDVNPLLCGPDRVVALDARIVI